MMNKILIIILTFLIIGCKSKGSEARRPISTKTGSFIKTSIERNKKLNEKEHALIKEIINKQKENNYIASKNGFWYYYNTKVETDTLKTPKFGDIVNYNYNVKTLNGNTIYSTEEIKTQNYAMDKEELFSGLREGLKLLKTGETATFLFPSLKAYGYYGDENKIGHNVPLVCKVSINSITLNKTN